MILCAKKWGRSGGWRHRAVRGIVVCNFRREIHTPAFFREERNFEMDIEVPDVNGIDGVAIKRAEIREACIRARLSEKGSGRK